MSEVKLKPCPFCSGKPKMATCDWGYSVKEYWYYCSYCGCETQKYHSKEDAAEQWNTRKPIDDIVERLEKQAEQCRNRGFEAEEKGFFETADTYYGKKSSYFHAIDIVRNAGKDGAE